jgi:site-specific recombinase XerD
MVDNEWLVWKEYLVLPGFACKKWTSSHIHMAVDMLHDVLVKLYDRPSMSQLLNMAISIPVLTHFCRQLNDVIAMRTWKRNTTHIVLSVFRHLLTNARANKAVVRASRLLPLAPNSSILSRNLAPAVRVHLEKWIEIVRVNTNNRSDTSLQNVISFFVRTLLPRSGVRIESWPQDAENIELKCKEQSFLREVVGSGKSAATKLHWVQVFLTHVLCCDYTLPKEMVRHLSRRQIANETDDSDHHRMSKKELECLYEFAVKNELNELFFLTLLTTGMRIGGFVKMKCAHVADVIEGKWCVRAEGKTVEKGDRMFSFKIHARVQELLASWLNKDRALIECEYVFPGSDHGHLTTQSFRRRFKNMCAQAGLKGAHLHPHALRHSYSYMLLQLGNSAEVVSKLINHANVATTQKYYLKETAAEVSERAIVPWIQPAPKRACPVPDFLLPAQPNPALEDVKNNLRELLAKAQAKT